jgi:hypothetical protein
MPNLHAARQGTRVDCRTHPRPRCPQWRGCLDREQWATARGRPLPLGIVPRPARAVGRGRRRHPDLDDKRAPAGWADPSGNGPRHVEARLGFPLARPGAGFVRGTSSTEMPDARRRGRPARRRPVLLAATARRQGRSSQAPLGRQLGEIHRRIILTDPRVAPRARLAESAAVDYADVNNDGERNVNPPRGRQSRHRPPRDGLK